MVNVGYFNPRPREGGDIYDAGNFPGRKDFNPRPREGGDARTGPASGPPGDFNPRPREGGDEEAEAELRREQDISIHAPARGATDYCIVHSLPRRISIHAPARGATRF